MGDILDAYDDVDSFFNDLIGDVDILDIVKDVGGELLSPSSGEDTSIDGIDIDDSSNTPKGVMSEAEDQIKKSQAIKSVDPRNIENEWIERLRAISKGQVYNYGRE